MSRMSGFEPGSTSGGASSSRPQGRKTSGSRASRGASSLQGAEEPVGGPVPAIPREEVGNYGGRLLSGGHICDRDDFEYWVIEHTWRGHYFFCLHPELLPLPRQWCEPDHQAASGVYNYESYRYLLDLIGLDEVDLRPFWRYEELD